MPAMGDGGSIWLAASGMPNVRRLSYQCGGPVVAKQAPCLQGADIRHHLADAGHRLLPAGFGSRLADGGKQRIRRGTYVLAVA